MDDAAFKRLFSDSRMARLLIRRDVPEWAGRVDYDTLRQLPTELVDERLVRRYPDMAWQVSADNGATDLVLLLEFQGRPERHMALRTTLYACLLTEALFRRDGELRRGERELAVVNLVLYHGARRWNARTHLRELYGESAPDTYRVVAPTPGVGRATGPEDLPRAVLALSGAGTDASMRSALAEVLPLVELLGDGEFDRFVARAVAALLRSKGFDSEQLEEAMTTSTVVTKFQSIRDEVRQMGIAEGREEGRVGILVQLIESKFGPAAAEEVQRSVLTKSDPDRIARVSAAILDCKDTGEFLARIREHC